LSKNSEDRFSITEEETALETKIFRKGFLDRNPKQDNTPFDPIQIENQI